MGWRKVSFQTTATVPEIKKALEGMGYINYLSIERSKEPRKKMGDWKQILIIWGTAFIVSIVAFLYIEWGTRP